MRLTRRRALQSMSATALTAGGLAAGCLPGRVPEVELSTLQLAKQKVKTLVVLMMENRSFDHSFGAMSLIEGKGVDGLTSSMTNPDVDGNAVSPLEVDLGCIADPPHGWDASHAQFNGGACDGFIREYSDRVDDPTQGHRVMDYLPRSKQTASWALAEEYALCQRWFASVMGPTWPNRFYLLACSSHGRQSNDFISEPIDTIFSKMDRAKIPWGNYYGNIQFAVTLDISTSFPEVEPLDQFFADAAAGTLPPVVILDPLYGRADDHPPAHPVAGQLYIQSIYDALRTSPQWNECMFVVTYDEHGGFHDHVAPPLVDDDRADEGFDQLGFRVPSFAVGPWVKNQVSDVVFDHSSVYATIAALHGLDPIQSRDASANNLLSLLDVERMREGAPREGIVLPEIVADEAEIFADECKGVRFHVDGVQHEAVTGQPELEAALLRKDPLRHARLRADTDGVWRELVDRAKSRGLLRFG